MYHFLRVQTAGIVVCAASGLLMVSAAAPDADSPIAKSITVESPDVGAIESVLHIEKRTGSFELHSPVEVVSLGIDFYRDGDKVGERPKLITQVLPPGEKTGKFSVHIVDLDYLPLEGGKKDHSRIQLELSFGSTRGRIAHDLPRSEFDFGKSFGSGGFNVDAGTSTEVPLFYMAAGAHGFKGGKTIDHIIKNNKGVVAIVSLHIRARSTVNRSPEP
ncbi:MAG TPA: hypothetical protein VGZ22_22500 [Isosphaeraceae bacterium]|jgi:hypothetical protein|nr:hypothetical protein [Isosphaeraceae bacterium]